MINPPQPGTLNKPSVTPPAPPTPTSVPQAPGGFAGFGTRSDLGQNWRVAFRDPNGLPLNMQSFEVIDFGAISYKEIFQNVKTIVATPMFSAALERLLGVDARIVDLPIDAAADATVALLQAIYSWEPRAQAVEINFDADVLNGHLIVQLQLDIRNVIYATEQPYDRNNIFGLQTISPPPTVIPPRPATTYLLAGPSKGTVNVVSTPFLVTLLPQSDVDTAVTITPNDGSAALGIGSAFTPASVTLSAAYPTAKFTYKPTQVGVKQIATTNDGGLANPPRVKYVVEQAATDYILTGPPVGAVDTPSLEFTVKLATTLDEPVTVTPDDGGAGGTFTPPFVVISAGSPPPKFTYVPAATGEKVITVTNDGGLIDPLPITYVSVNA
jgi:phage baseplate assembly protein W